MTDKAPWGGNEVKRTKDFRLMKDENKSEIPFPTRGIEIYFGHNAFLSPEEKAMQTMQCMKLRANRIYSTLPPLFSNFNNSIC